MFKRLSHPKQTIRRTRSSFPASPFARCPDSRRGASTLTAKALMRTLSTWATFFWTGRWPSRTTRLNSSWKGSEIFVRETASRSAACGTGPRDGARDWGWKSGAPLCQSFLLIRAKMSQCYLLTFLTLKARQHEFVKVAVKQEVD